MKEKKQSASWYIAATHYLTAGFVIPLIISLILGVLVTAMLGKEETILSAIIFALASIISTFFGVIYSSRYIAKTYIIKNSNSVIKIATIYVIVISGVYRLYIFEKGLTSISIIGFCSFVGVVLAFYYTSKKYIKSTTI